MSLQLCCCCCRLFLLLLSVVVVVITVVVVVAVVAVAVFVVIDVAVVAYVAVVVAAATVVVVVVVASVAVVVVTITGGSTECKLILRVRLFCNSFFQLMSLNDELLPDYKLDVPHTPPRVILHYTGFKTTWDWIILFLTLYTTVSVPLIVCFEFDDLGLAILDLMVDWLFLADIALNFHTTYVGKEGEVIDNLKMIRWNYLRSWFFLDLVSSLPFGILYFVSKNSDAVSCLLQPLNSKAQ